MQFVILDLEWNTAFDKRGHQYISEIIEFGAIKLDEELKTVDTYARFVKPQIEKHLHSRVKKLTHITNEDIKDAAGFLNVADDFARWIGDVDNTVILSWGDMDVRALTENYRYYLSDPTIPFLKYYADAQAFFMKQKDLQPSQQIGLSNAAEMIHLDAENYVHHRALGDCEMTSVIFRVVYDEDRLTPFIRICNEEYYRRLLFHPYMIKDIHSPYVEEESLSCKCMDCHIPCQPTTKWVFANSSFRAFFLCPECGQKYRCNVQIRRLYSQINTKKTVTKLEETDAESEA